MRELEETLDGLKREYWPTAVIALNDLVAIGCLAAARERGIAVPEEEAYAANTLWMNGKAIVPAGYPKMEKIVRELGYEVVLVDTSEYRKIDGGLSCLSLRF